MCNKNYLATLFIIVTGSLLLLGATYTTTPIENEHISIIFDMNGVLVQTHKARRYINIRNFIRYAFTHNPFTMQKVLREKLFNLLNNLQKRDIHEVEAHDDQGNLLPQIMCDWMKGTRTPHQLKEAVQAELNKRPRTLEIEILHDLVEVLFTPSTFAHTQQLVPEAITWVEQLKKEGYKLYIISNFCSESFNIIKNEHPSFFSLFDDILISGDIGIIKPNPTIYNYLLSTHSLCPNKCFFIDDQLVNIKTALKLGIECFVCPAHRSWNGNKTPDIKSAEKAFNQWRKQLTVDHSSWLSTFAHI